MDELNIFGVELRRELGELIDFGFEFGVGSGGELVEDGGCSMGAIFGGKEDFGVLLQILATTGQIVSRNVDHRVLE